MQTHDLHIKEIEKYNAILEKVEDSKKELYLTYAITTILILACALHLLLTMYKSITHLLKTFKRLHEESDIPIKGKNEFKQIHYFLEHFVEKTVQMRERISEHKNELYKKLYFDELTKLPNRNKLFADLEKRKKVIVALINIDGFHYINDNYGDEFGDFILKKVAYKMSDFCNQHCAVYKLHADEYAIVISNQFPQDVDEFIKQLSCKISGENFYYRTFKTSINITIGYGDNLQKADMALKKAKKTQETVLNFEKHTELKNYYSDAILWKNKLKMLLEKDRLLPYFQPIVDLKTLEVVKYEALCRLKDENGDIITPNTFMQVAKNSRLYSQITRMMVEKSFEVFQDKNFKISINISIEDILNQETVLFFEKMIKKFKMFGKVEFEITESEKIYDFKKVEKFIKHFKLTHDCTFAIDDFGNGYSNFEYLLQLKIDVVKIDGSLIKNFIFDSKKSLLLQHIANLSKDLDIQTVAEFVEDGEMVSKLKEIGITRGQGYFFSKPMSQITCLVYDKNVTMKEAIL
jgi:diguanylate cyclase (GGDEF)-like protein